MQNGFYDSVKAGGPWDIKSQTTKIPKMGKAYGNHMETFTMASLAPQPASIGERLCSEWLG